LRERREDVPLLAVHFLARELGKSRASSPGITRGALAALVGYGWPGNVRELENEIAKAVLLMEEGEPLDLAHLSRRVRAEVETDATCLPLSLEDSVRRAETEAFRVAQAAAQGDPARAMELLGVSRATYYRRLRELGLGSDEDD
jgi:DNA-binding NtrC family response regulator